MAGFSFAKYVSIAFIGFSNQVSMGILFNFLNKGAKSRIIKSRVEIIRSFRCSYQHFFAKSNPLTDRKNM